MRAPLQTIVVLFAVVFLCGVPMSSALAAISFSSVASAEQIGDGARRAWSPLSSYSGGRLLSEQGASFSLNAFGCKFAVASKPVDTNDVSDPDLTAIAFRARLMFSGFDKPKTETFFGQLLSPQVADITELPPSGFKCKTNWSYFISINRGVSRGGERLLYLFLIVLPYKVAHPTGDGAEHLYQIVMSQDIFSPTEWDSVKRKGVDVGIAILQALIK